MGWPDGRTLPRLPTLSFKSERSRRWLSLVVGGIILMTGLYGIPVALWYPYLAPLVVVVIWVGLYVTARISGAPGPGFRATAALGAGLITYGIAVVLLRRVLEPFDWVALVTGTASALAIALHAATQVAWRRAMFALLAGFAVAVIPEPSLFETDYRLVLVLMLPLLLGVWEETPVLLRHRIR